MGALGNGWKICLCVCKSVLTIALCWMCLFCLFLWKRILKTITLKYLHSPPSPVKIAQFRISYIYYFLFMLLMHISYFFAPLFLHQIYFCFFYLKFLSLSLVFAGFFVVVFNKAISFFVEFVKWSDTTGLGETHFPFGDQFFQGF